MKSCKYNSIIQDKQFMHSGQVSSQDVTYQTGLNKSGCHLRVYAIIHNKINFFQVAQSRLFPSKLHSSDVAFRTMQSRSHRIKPSYQDWLTKTWPSRTKSCSNIYYVVIVIHGFPFPGCTSICLDRRIELSIGSKCVSHENFQM